MIDSYGPIDLTKCLSMAQAEELRAYMRGVGMEVTGPPAETWQTPTRYVGTAVELTLWFSQREGAIVVREGSGQEADEGYRSRTGPPQLAFHEIAVAVTRFMTLRGQVDGGAQ